MVVRLAEELKAPTWVWSSPPELPKTVLPEFPIRHKPWVVVNLPHRTGRLGRLFILTPSSPCVGFLA